MFKSSLVCALGVMVLVASPAESAYMCGKHVDFVKALTDKFQEQGKAMAIAGQRNLLEVFTSKAGTWTILLTSPEGKTCIVAAGNSWEDLPPTKNLTSL
jgi:hypothetical protein